MEIAIPSQVINFSGPVDFMTPVAISRRTKESFMAEEQQNANTIENLGTPSPNNCSSTEETGDEPGRRASTGSCSKG